MYMYFNNAEPQTHVSMTNQSINQSINDKRGNITSLPINTATLKLYIRTFVHSIETHIRVPHTDKRLSVAYLIVDLPQDDS